MKKIIGLILTAVLLLSLSTFSVSAEENIKVIIDITTVKFDDVPPTIVNGRTLVPLRAIFEALGATVEWDDATQTVTSEKGDTKISLTIDSNIMTVNGEEKTLDVPATLIDSRTLVPVRAISESFGLQVGWDGENNIVSILSNTETFTMLYAAGSRSRVFAKSSAATQEKHGWHTYPVTAVYTADGKETVVATAEVQSYLDGGYYAYPVKTIYKADGTEVVIALAELNSYLANGYLTQKPVIAVENEEGGNGTKIDYSVYGDVTEEQLAIIATASMLKYVYEIETTTVHFVYAGYYNDEFIVMPELTSTFNGSVSRGTVVGRLEQNSTASFQGQKWKKGSLPRASYDWANKLIDQRPDNFKKYSSKAFIDAVMEIALKK